MLIDSNNEPFPKQLAQKLAEIFSLSSVVLFDRREDQTHRAGPLDFDGLEEQLRESALQGTIFVDSKRSRVIMAVRLGSEPIASLAVQGELAQDSVLQGISNLVAIGLERSRAQDLAHQIEAAQRTERLRTTLIDAMAHEFKTPLTSIKAVTTSLLASPDQPKESNIELLNIANEEVARLEELIDQSIEMARLDSAQIDIQAEPSDLGRIAREVIDSMQTAIDDRKVEAFFDPQAADTSFDRRLVKLAVKQLIDNALKYSDPGTPIMIRLHSSNGMVGLEITNSGKGIPAPEQPRIFQRFYRSPSQASRIPGSGLGLSIAHRIAQAHGGDLTVTSGPGETTFRLALPVAPKVELR